MKSKITLTMFVAALCLSAQMLAQVLPYGSVCNDAIPLDCGVPVTGSTLNVPNDNATSGASAVTCMSSPGSSGQIWYTFTASSDQLLTVSTCGAASFDTKLHVYEGSCGQLICVASNDDACGLQSTVAFAGITGSTYLLRVGGFGSTAGDFTVTLSCQDSNGGCMDPNASNYDASATYSDNSCIYPGCTDSAALNYNAQANQDDGSCNYCNGANSVSGQLYVCTFSNGADVTLTITDSQGNVVANVSGLGNNQIEYLDVCLNAGECYSVAMSNASGNLGWSNGYFWINVNGGQVINESLNPGQSAENTFFSIDGTCVAIGGCMDPAASNYNANANVDNGSCQYAPECETGSVVTVSMTTVGFPSECSFSITDDAGTVLYNGNSYYNSGTFTSFLCLEDGCYTVIMFDSFGDGWNGGYLTITALGTSSTYTISQGENGAGVFSINTTGCEANVQSGCTNPAADNYNPAAMFDDGSCVISGCMDASAINYQWNATVDDGSCQYCDGPGSTIANLYICTFSNGAQVELQIVDDAGNEIYYAYGLGNSAIVNAQLCLQPGVCYTANMINNTGAFGWYNGYFWVNVNGNQIINAEPGANQQFASVQFSIDGTCGPVFGCTDPAATNYNDQATSDDGSCIYPYAGCTDPEAVNYDANASIDNGSCVYAGDCTQNFVSFSLDPGIFANEASYSITDANGAIVASGSGYTTFYACLPDGCYTINMYDSFGDGWDGSGTLTIAVNGNYIGVYTLSTGTYGTEGFGLNAEGCVPEVLGCTDPTAVNYNYLANTDDGSCIYPESCESNFTYIDIYTQSFGSEVSWSLVAEDGTIVASGSGYSSWGYYSTYVCIPDGCYELQMNDSWGDGWNGAYYMIYTGNNYYEGSLFYGSSTTDLIGINSDCGLIAGCTDAAALNYNPQATYDDGSCTYNDSNPIGVGPGLEMDFTFYPNPTNSEININLTNLDFTENIQVSFVGLDGKIVNQVQIANESASRLVKMDVSELAAGYYFIQVANGDHHKVMPLIKQ